MTSDVWYGALLSIPIGIATGLAVPLLQRWWENRGNKKQANEERRTKEEYLQVAFYKNHPETFTQYLVHVAIQTTFIGAIVGVLSAVFYAVNQVVPDVSGLPFPFYFGAVHRLVSLLGQVMAIVSSLLIIRICRPAMALWRKMRDFDKYKRSLPTELVDPSERARQAYERRTGKAFPATNELESEKDV